MEDKFDNMYEGRFDALQKKYEAEQDQIAKLKQFVAEHSSGKQAKQAQSKQKQLDRMLADATEAVLEDAEVKFQFFLCGKLPPPGLHQTPYSSVQAP